MEQKRGHSPNFLSKNWQLNKKARKNVFSMLAEQRNFRNEVIIERTEIKNVIRIKAATVLK